MISGGLIAGGQTAPTAPGAPAGPVMEANPTATVGSTPTGSTYGFPMEPIKGVTIDNMKSFAKDVDDRLESRETTKGWFNLFDNVLKFVGGWIGTYIQYDTAENINDRKAGAAEHISDNQKEYGLRMADVMDNRAPIEAATAEQVAQINANKEIDINKDTWDAKERIAAGRDADQLFDTRRDPFLGTPV